MDGTNYWLWAFVGRWTVIYEIDRSCAKVVLQRILKGYCDNLTSDLYGAWNHVGTTHQRYHIHYLRETDDTIHYKTLREMFVGFARRFKRIIYDSHDAAKIKSKSKRLLAKQRLERRITNLISQKYAEENCVRFVKRIRREQKMLFTFLITRTDSHNNAAERAIRPNVIIRKITNGHRSEDGIFSHKVLMSIKETCRVRGLNFHDYALEYLGNITSKL